MPITTHVLDTSLGKPASHVLITLESLVDPKKPELVAEAFTNDDGRVLPALYDSPQMGPGCYRINFMVEEYFLRTKHAYFYPIISVVFVLKNPREHFHIPLLLSPFGYSTYRGS